MIILHTHGLTMRFGERTLFDQISFELGDRDKVGLVGANGTGKTTLFRLITGELTPEEGEIIRSKQCKIGYMEQQVSQHSQRTVMEEMLTVFDSVRQLERQLQEVSLQIERRQGNLEELIRRQMQLNEAFQREDGLTYRSRARSALLGLGFEEEMLTRPIGQLSGGQKSKISLAKLLVSEASLLLLDEPTNHLDIHAVQWLEGFLMDYKKAFFIISHDRYFLDRVTGRTVELEHKKLQVYTGNYSTYLQKKEKAQEDLVHRYQDQMKEIHRIEGIIEQQRSWNRERNIRTAESKQKMLDRLKEELVVPEQQQKGIRFTFGGTVTSGKDVLQCFDLSKSFGENTLFRGVNLHIQRGERVFLLGANGCGKTTLFKMIHGDIPQDDGAIQLGSNVTTGYFDQTQSLLHNEKTVLDEVWDDFTTLTQTEVRNALAAFLFRGEEVGKRVSSLSGGERARVAILKLMLSQSNFLLLDEPTNHLDIKSSEALEQALTEYQGTLFIISHDRYFIRKIADRVLYLDSQGVTQVHQDISEFLETMSVIPLKQPSAAPQSPSAGGANYKRKKELNSEYRRLLGRIKRCEEELEELHQSTRALEDSLQHSDHLSDYQKILEISTELESKRVEEGRLTADWEELSESLLDMEETLAEYGISPNDD